MDAPTEKYVARHLLNPPETSRLDEGSVPHNRHMGMEPLTRWIQREENQTAGVLRVFAGMAGGLFVICLLAMVNQARTETVPAVAYALTGFFLVLAFALFVPTLRVKRRPKEQVRLDSLLMPAFQGKLAETLGANAETLGRAAGDLEQATELLRFTPVDEAFAAMIRETGNRRMRRMLELTVAAPGRLGLTVDQAAAQIAADGAWLAELRRLVEASRESESPAAEDDPLGHLRELVRAREEAVGELRSFG